MTTPQKKFNQFNSMVALNQLSFPMAPGEPRSENAGHVDVATAEGGWVRIGWLYIEPPKMMVY